MRWLFVLAGGALLVWPAALNLYPLLFVDSFGYVRQVALAAWPWDKPLAYGVLIHALHWQWSLWPVVLAQGLAASWLLWLVQRGLRGAASVPVHLLFCAALGLFTTGPWFLATVMPDALTAQLPLCLYLLAFGRLSRAECWAVGLWAVVAAAVHLTHVPVALGLVVLTALLTRRVAPVLRVAAPVLLALLLVATSNLAAFGRFSVSPHGATFLLARLQDDGPALWLMRERCGSGPEWRLCGFLDRFPMDAEDFLWGISPLNSEADGSLRKLGGLRAVPEAGAIVGATVARYPAEVASAMFRNALSQLTLFELGDTLTDNSLDSTREVIEALYPPRELAAMNHGLQARGLLERAAAPFLPGQFAVVLLALVAAPVLLWRAARQRDMPRAALILFALAALCGNGAVAGALSKPLDRYQARIIWLLPAVIGLALMPSRHQGTPGEG